MAAGNTVSTAKNTDFSFPASRECSFAEQLIQVSLLVLFGGTVVDLTLVSIKATDNLNADDFATACADFDRISPLDPFKTSMLVAVIIHSDCSGVF